MTLLRLSRLAIAVFLAAWACGCDPTRSGQSDEEREPYFQRGRERVNTMDYSGAIEAFEKALEINPRSGAAHFELGCLYSDKQREPAAAIYHYGQYLKLRPNADNADIIRQHILGLKQDLARVVALPLPPTPGVARQIEQLMAQNRRLTEELERLQGQLGVSNVTNSLVREAVRTPAASSGGVTNSTPGVVTSMRIRPANTEPARNAAPVKVHRVITGETPSSIARKYKINLDALLAANPGLNPRRMQVGQELKIPSP